MPQLTIEEKLTGNAEHVFAEGVANLCKIEVVDCRQLAPPIRILAENLKLDMVIGCGGSHIYIHRANEFIQGQNNNPLNKRWAIITD